MNTKLNILAVNRAETSFTSHYSGYIGIAPPNLETTGTGENEKFVEDPSLNFMYQLKENGNIKH